MIVILASQRRGTRFMVMEWARVNFQGRDGMNDDRELDLEDKY